MKLKTREMTDNKKLQPVRGTKDLLPDEMAKFNAIIDMAKHVSTLYGFSEMSTPIFESTDVFKRSIGETSDIVNKEMYSFESRGGESLTLRPEFTAGIVRAFISNGMQQNLPLKLFSYGPLFRYERPQKGRQRQFHQINCEWLGDDSIYADIEILTMAAQMLYYLTNKKGCTLHINTLGDAESREKYQAALVKYLSKYEAELSADSQRRLKENPLRILDSKDKNDQKILEDAPKIHDGNYLSHNAQVRFDKICEVLSKENSPVLQNIVIDPTIVRGLDYYTGVVFEFKTDIDGIGSQNTVLAGGRYDNLIEEMGGKPTPAIGFAGGLERLMLVSRLIAKEVRPIYVVVENEDEKTCLFAGIFASVIRGKSYNKKSNPVEVLYSGSLKKRFKKANQNNASHVIIVNDELFSKGKFTIKDMDSGEERICIKDEVFKYFGLE